MNIFVLDADPLASARMMCDAHVVKMIVESCQLLSSHDRLTKDLSLDDKRYKITHQNHPCRVCLSNPQNRLWLISHLWALITEYQYRYSKAHSCMFLCAEYWLSELDSCCIYLSKTSFPKCMPEEFKVGGGFITDVVQSYRNYYKHKQSTMHRFRYTNREIPEWLKGEDK